MDRRSLPGGLRGFELGPPGQFPPPAPTLGGPLPLDLAEPPPGAICLP